MSTPVANAFYVHQQYNRIVIEGAREQVIRLYLQPYFTSLQTLPGTRCIDLLRIATAVYGIDRIVKRTFRADNPDKVRTLHINIEVEDLEFWKEAYHKDLIEEIFYVLTDDNWKIHFIPVDNSHLSSCYESFLDLPNPEPPSRLALYSGGLDSAAGLASQLINNWERYLLVTVGHYPGLRKRVNEQIAELVKLLDVPVPQQAILITHLRGGAARRIDMQEPSQRSRAFLFYATAAVSARAFGIDSIEVFENGVGAVNFPLTSTMLNSGLATRGAHPTFLRYMSELVTLVTESRLTYKLPFSDSTKGEMLKPLGGRGLDTWLQQSHSCIHTSLRIKGVRHCGQCPACIERRQAFMESGIEENVSDYGKDIMADMASMYQSNDYFRIYCNEADAWLNKEPRTLRRMMNHLRATFIPEEEDRRIYKLQDRHSEEVGRIFPRDGCVSIPRRVSSASAGEFQCP